MKNHFMSPFAEAKGQIHNIIWGGFGNKRLKAATPKIQHFVHKGQKE